MPKQFYMVKADAESDEFLKLKPDMYADRCREAAPADITLDALAYMLDRDAENQNKHAFCGTHNALGTLLAVELDHKRALRVMIAIAEAGGLHEME